VTVRVEAEARRKVFNTEQMNQAVFAFRRYDDASLRYTGIESDVTFIEEDDVIEAFAADRANDALDVGVLPRRSQRGDDLLDSHRLDAVAECRPT
jgi:hypothetical protein